MCRSVLVPAGCRRLFQFLGGRSGVAPSQGLEGGPRPLRLRRPGAWEGCGAAMAFPSYFPAAQSFLEWMGEERATGKPEGGQKSTPGPVQGCVLTRISRRIQP